MAAEFSTLERNILRAKGLTDDHLTRLADLGVLGRDDFQTVGDLGTLLELMPDLDMGVAERVLDWAVPPAPSSPAAGGLGVPLTAGAQAIPTGVVLNTSDTVFCIHCGTRQPKDYSPGDLCTNCGLQAEPVETCYWCGASGPGRYCRACGAAFVSTAEFSLALLLRRDGVSRDDIPRRLDTMSQSEKEALWGRVRRART